MLTKLYGAFCLAEVLMIKAIKNLIKKESIEFKLLLKSVPATVVTLFVVSVISMNLLANKTLLQVDWIALDGGILISWLSFMCMDIITKHFGPKASNSVAILASMINLLTCLIFFVASAIPSNAGDYTAFNGIFGGTWFILLGSTVAFLASAIINNSINWLIGRGFLKNPDSRIAYAARTYISTFIGYRIYVLRAYILGRFFLDAYTVRGVCADGCDRRAGYGDPLLAYRLSHYE